MRQLIKTDGTVQDLPEPVSNEKIRELIGARVLDTVQLRHLDSTHVMYVDDLGHVEGRKAVNAKATEHYHANCYPGTMHQIVGDVVICPVPDYA